MFSGQLWLVVCQFANSDITSDSVCAYSNICRRINKNKILKVVNTKEIDWGSKEVGLNFTLYLFILLLFFATHKYTLISFF